MKIEAIPRFDLTPQVNGSSHGETGKTFQNFFDQALKGHNDLSAARSADRMDLLTGDLEELHSLQISGAKSGLSNDMLWAIRNKMLDAYTEIIRFQI